MEVFNRALVVNNAFYACQLRVFHTPERSLEAQTDVNFWTFLKQQIFLFKMSVKRQGEKN